jgi:uncharacterized protein (TIGR03437 family)
VTRSGATILTGSFTVASVSPGIFTANGNGAGVVAGTETLIDGRANGIVGTLPLYSCGTVALSCLETPIAVSGVPGRAYAATFYATGIRGAKSVQVYVAGMPVPLGYAGPQGSFAGLDQVNLSPLHPRRNRRS